MAREWQYYHGPGGRNSVLKEIKKCGFSKRELADLQVLMDRHSAGRTLRHDYKPLRDGVHELRLSGNNRIFRLYFGNADDGLVLLALHFAPKKKQKDDDAIDLAVRRLKEWQQRQ